MLAVSILRVGLRYVTSGFDPNHRGVGIDAGVSAATAPRPAEG